MITFINILYFIPKNFVMDILTILELFIFLIFIFLLVTKFVLKLICFYPKGHLFNF